MAPGDLALGEQFSDLLLCISLSLQVWKWWFLCNLHFSSRSEESHAFSVCPPFSYCKDRGDSFQFLYVLDLKLGVLVIYLFVLFCPEGIYRKVSPMGALLDDRSGSDQ